MLDQEDRGMLGGGGSSAVWLPQSWTACGNAARLYNCYCNDYCPAQARPKVKSQDFAAAADSPPELPAVLPAARHSSQTCNLPTTQGFLASSVTAEEICGLLLFIPDDTESNRNPNRQIWDMCSLLFSGLSALTVLWGGKCGISKNI